MLADVIRVTKASVVSNSHVIGLDAQDKSVTAIPMEAQHRWAMVSGLLTRLQDGIIQTSS